MSLHFFFLLNKKEILLGSIGKSSASFTWVLTILCLGHSALLGQYQKCMQLQLSLTKNSLTPVAMGIIEVWRGLMCDLNIFFAAVIESVITMIS